MRDMNPKLSSKNKIISKYFYKLFCFFLFYQLSTSVAQDNLYERWHQTDLLIRDKKIDRDAAIDSVVLYIELALKQAKTLDIEYTKRKDWAFPMEGYTLITYRSNGQDYRDKGFDYFQGGESKGHPAHDIFILDKDSNALEDSTGEKVFARSMVTGYIITTLPGWKPGNVLRSGNYVKIFDPYSEAMFYYSHLDTVFVKPGQFVKAGEKIGYVGRTGRKAINGRTHLHIAYYKIEDGEPIPEEFINDLRKCEQSMKK